MPLSEEVNKLTRECAELNARLARALKARGLDFLIWESPTSERDPEITRIWHPVYLRKGLILRIAVYIYTILYYSYTGIKQFFMYRGMYYTYHTNGAPLLLIIPEAITDHSAECRTSYIVEDESTVLDKLVFSRDKAVGTFFSALNFRRRIQITGQLLYAALKDTWITLFQGRCGRYYMDSLLLFIRWVISQSWCFHWDFYHMLKKVLPPAPSQYRGMLALHEMHFYSRLLWRFAREQGMRSVTAQHAMITPEKLWYFPDIRERKAGLALPDLFFVYSEATTEMLRSYYPATRFQLCCSPRFDKWRSVAVPSSRQEGHNNQAPRILFVGGIMFYDTAILVRGLKRLIKTQNRTEAVIRIRLHPHGAVAVADQLWLIQTARSGRIQMTRGALEKDFSESDVVIGSGSTVMQEACLLGIPVVNIFDENYLNATVFPEGFHRMIPVENLSWEVIWESIKQTPDETLAKQCRVSMGIQNPMLSSRCIYETLKS